MMMKIGTMYEQRDVVLIPIPFSDLSFNKQRPVIIISNNRYNQRSEDIVVVAMTSNPATVDYGFTITSTDLEQGELRRASMVRCDKIYSISQSLVLKRFGRVRPDTLSTIHTMLFRLVEQ